MGPDFLCIGAQKAGTTWLQDNLARHPQIWLPPVKEIHYFDRPRASLRRRLMGTNARLRTGRRHLRQTGAAFLRGKAAPAELGWALRYVLSERSDDWYLGLFHRPAGGLAGEVCPGYARLPKDRIAHVKSLLPQARIIYLLRDPVERAWSAVAMHFNKEGQSGFSQAETNAVEAWIRHPKSLEHGDYLSAIQNWSELYGERLLIGYYDELAADPAAFLGRIHSFLGVPAVVPPGVGQRSNAGAYAAIPSHFRALLVAQFLPQMLVLQERLRSPIVQGWINRYRLEEPARAKA